MSPLITNLITDIYNTVNSKSEWFTDALANDLSGEITKRLKLHYGIREGKPTLRLSQMGPKCPRALWYSIYHPELAVPLRANTMLMYSYGHVIEAQAIALSKAAGHEVTGEQDELVVDGIKGHRDCVIDGCIVDVKSCSTPNFNKFKDGSIKDSDTFGYLDQLDGYLVGSSDDPLVRSKDRAYILAVDKTLGNMALYEHRIREQSIRDRISEYKQIVQRSSPPACCCGTTADTDDGNVKLDTRASYSAFKHCCFPNLRTFIYSKGPIYFTRVVKTPKHKGIPLKEIDKYGMVVGY